MSSTIYSAMHQNQRIRVKLATDAETSVAFDLPMSSRSPTGSSASFDMYGICFRHPDLRRILTDYGFEGTRCARISRHRPSSKCADDERKRVV